MESQEGRQIVDEILRQMSGPAELSASPAVLAAMIQVGRRHPGGGVADEAVVADLVQAALGASKPALFGNDKCREMCDWIAHSLCEDPVARPRLESLWDQLMASGER